MEREKCYFLAFVVVEWSGKLSEKLSEITLVTSLLASSKIAAIRSVRIWAENHGVLCSYKSKVSNFKFTEDPKLPQEWLKEWKEDRFNPQNTDSRVCADQFTPQVAKSDSIEDNRRFSMENT